MAIMATGVHHARTNRRIRHPGFFLDRQRIDICPQSEGLPLPRLGAPNNAQYSGRDGQRRHFHVQFCQFTPDQCGRLHFLEANLGILMQLSSDCRKFCLLRLCRLQNSHLLPPYYISDFFCIPLA